MKIVKFVGGMFVALFAGGVFAGTATAQTVSTESAAAFIGDWNIAVQADAPAPIKVNIADNAGQVAATVTGIEGTVTKVEDISRSAEALVLKYQTSLQGQNIPIKITLTPQAQAGSLAASIDLADGMATLPGTVTSAER